MNCTPFEIVLDSFPTPSIPDPQGEWRKLSLRMKIKSNYDRFMSWLALVEPIHRANQENTNEWVRWSSDIARGRVKRNYESSTLPSRFFWDDIIWFEDRGISPHPGSLPPHQPSLPSSPWQPWACLPPQPYIVYRIPYDFSPDETETFCPTGMGARSAYALRG